MVPCLNEECGVENNDCVRRPAVQLTDLRRVDVKDLGVEAAVKPGSLLRVMKNDLAQLSAVYTAVGREDVSSEVFHDLVPGLLMRLKKFVNNPVSIDELGPEIP
jgi:hypothetical protein